MTKRSRPDFNIIILNDMLSLLTKEEILEFISNSFYKKDLLYAIKSVYEQYNIKTNDAMEKEFYKLVKSPRD